MKMLASNKWKIQYHVAVYGLFALFYLWMAAQIPYTHDDWDWGLEIGLEQLLTASINSRYTGNFFEVIMTRSELLKTVIIGASFFLLPYIISGIVFGGKDEKARKDRMLGFVLCNAMLLSMNRAIWQQTYGWIAGYANFGLSAIFLFIILKEMLAVFDAGITKSKGRILRVIALIPACLAGQLFLENISIYVCLSAVVINFCYWRKTGKISWEYLLLLLTSVVGLGIMFSSSLYKGLWLTGEAIGGYRKLLLNSQTDVHTLVVNCFHQFNQLMQKLYTENLFVCVVILVLMCVLLLRDSMADEKKAAFCVANGVMVFGLLMSRSMGSIAGSVVSVLFFVTVAYELALLFKNEKPVLYKLLFVWSSPVCIILPIAFTTELGPRLFFTPYAILILFAAFLVQLGLDSPQKKKYCLVAAFCLAGLFLINYGSVYSAIGECKNLRNEIMENAVKTEADTILLPKYPYLEYLWLPNPNSPEREVFFKEFYNIPQDITVIFEE